MKIIEKFGGHTNAEGITIWAPISVRITQHSARTFQSKTSLACKLTCETKLNEIR